MTPDEEAALEELIWELTAPHTVEEIGKRLGCRHQLVSQIQKRALKKLRALLEENGITEPDADEPAVLHLGSGDEPLSNGMTRKKLF